MTILRLTCSKIIGPNLCGTITSSPPRYDDTPLELMSFTQTVNNTGSLMASAPMLPLHMFINPTQ